MNNIKLDEAMVILPGCEKEIDSFAWNPHPSFRGVSMKNIICGSDTHGRLSCHIVKIEPGCEIGTHIHEGKMELHEVVNGSGFCEIGERTVDYKKGVVSYIPDDIIHRVCASDDGLLILAKFSPALI